jgi:hypothetical protein
MDRYEQQIHRERYLLTLHKLSEETTRPVGAEDVESHMGIEPVELEKVATYLAGEGFIIQITFTTIALTHSGLKEVERLLSLHYEEIEGRVLWMINYLCGGSLTKLVLISALARRLVRDEREMYPIVNDLDERKGLIKALNEAVLLLPAGKEALQESLRPQKPVAESQKPGDTYNTTIGTIHGPTQVGSHNVQNIQVSVIYNPEFDQAIAGLIQLIQASGLKHDDAEELKEEVAKLSRLALSEKKAGLLEKAKGRIDIVKVGLQGTEVLIKAAPLLQTVWEHFSK